MAGIPGLQKLDALGHLARWVTGLSVAMLLAGCSTFGGETVEPTDARYAQAEIEDHRLLDVGIQLFESVPPEDKDDDDAYNPAIRDAESRYIPYQLRQTLQPTGYWGSVEVIPSDAVITDVYISGRILFSNGEELVISLTVRDSTGTHWFTRVYETEIEEDAYVEASRKRQDPFQSFYNRVSNDLLEFREKLSPDRLKTIRNVSRLRFAADIAPDAFKGYLRKDEDGIYQVVRLPSDRDPLLQRVEQIRDRDFMLVDTVNAHYREFHDEMNDPYFSWRESYIMELKAREELEKQAWTRKLLAAVAIAAAIANEVYGNSHVATGVLVYGGMEAYKSGAELAESAEIHTDAIEELSESFGEEIEPVVLQVEGETVQLTGTAEQQYQQWRGMMRDLFVAETGFEAQSPPQPVSTRQ